MSRMNKKTYVLLDEIKDEIDRLGEIKVRSSRSRAARDLIEYIELHFNPSRYSLPLIVIALLAGCADPEPTPEPHDVVDCGTSWGGLGASCEYACRERPRTDDAIQASCEAGVQFQCLPIWNLDGVEGCCRITPALDVQFMECKP